MPEEKTMLERNAEANENKAKDSGWVPLEEWTKEPGDWVPATEFNFRGDLMRRIQSQTRAIQALKVNENELTTTLKAMGDHNKKMAEGEKKKVIKELKRERRTAAGNDDFDLVDEIEEKIEEVRDLEFEEPKDKTSVEPTITADAEKAFESFMRNNPWYNSDSDLTEIADTVGKEMMAETPAYATDPLRYYDDVAAAVKKKASNKFTKDKPQASDVTETSTNRSTPASGGSKKYTVRDLSDEQRSISKRFVAAGVFEKEQEYVDQLVELGEVT